MPGQSDSQYKRYFYHCFPQWIGSPILSSRPSFDAALRTLSLMFKWGLLLSPEELLFRGEPYRDEPDAEPIRLLQRRLCFTELAEAELPNHAQVFGPVALEFDQHSLRRIGGMPVVYIPQQLSGDPLRDHFALIGQTLVYRLFETYQLLSDLEQIKQDLGTLPSNSLSVTLGNPDSSSTCVFPVEPLRRFLTDLTHKRQPLAQLAGAMRVLSCFFYPTDASSTNAQGVADDGRLMYYREREWRIVGGVYFGDVPIEEDLSPEGANEIAMSVDGSYSPYVSGKIDSLAFVQSSSVVRTFQGSPVMNLVRRILAPAELVADVRSLADSFRFMGTVAAYSRD